MEVQRKKEKTATTKKTTNTKKYVFKLGEGLLLRTTRKPGKNS